MKIGPGLLVTAAFIGPGTVLMASKSGAQFGYSLLWVVVFSVLATIIFQEMAARLGIVTGKGLGEAINASFSNPVVKWAATILVVSAIFIGNAAYEAGNIAGAAEGALAPLGLGQGAFRWIAGGISLVALALLMSGRFKLIQWILVGLVALMSVFFLLASVISGPDWGKVAAGFIPTLPEKSFLLFVGLIGTTVVPYNLFLHASSAAKNWSSADSKDIALGQARIDISVAVVLGGLVTSAILVTAANSFYELEATERPEKISEFAVQLDSVLGRFGQTFFCFGLLAAGLTSAITAPLAASMAVSGCLNRTIDPADTWNRLMMVVVVLVGLAGNLFSATGRGPTQLLTFAQVANGFILPLIAVFLVYAMNNRSLLGRYVNRALANVAGIIVVIVITAVIAIKMYNSFLA